MREKDWNGYKQVLDTVAAFCLFFYTFGIVVMRQLAPAGFFPDWLVNVFLFCFGFFLSVLIILVLVGIEWFFERRLLNERKSVVA